MGTGIPPRGSSLMSLLPGYTLHLPMGFFSIHQLLEALSLLLNVPLSHPSRPKHVPTETDGFRRREIPPSRKGAKLF